MINPFLHAWGAALVGLLTTIAIVAGARIALRQTQEFAHNRSITRIFAFGTGAFVVAVCLDFLPDAWSGAGDATPLLILLGALVLWTATHFSDFLFNRGQNQQVAASRSALTTEGADFAPEPSLATWNTGLRFTPLSALVLAIALSFHTFLEGAAVSLAFHDLSWKTLGFSLAIILHKLPEGVLWGLSLAAVFPNDLFKIRRLLLIPAVFTCVGVFLGILLAQDASAQVLNVATGLVAGAMFYIAFAELLPSLREITHTTLARVWFLIGVAVMFLLNSLSALFGG